MTRFTSRLAVMALAAGAPISPVAAQGLTAIRAGRLVDTEKGEVRRDRLVLVRSERIESVQPGSARVPAGARVIDLSRYTVVPGLIDCHAHLIGDIPRRLYHSAGWHSHQVIARDRRFKAAISGAGQSNALAGYGTHQYVREYPAELARPGRTPGFIPGSRSPSSMPTGSSRLHCSSAATRIQRPAAQLGADAPGAPESGARNRACDLPRGVSRGPETELPAGPAATLPRVV